MSRVLLLATPSPIASSPTAQPAVAVSPLPGSPVPLVEMVKVGGSSGRFYLTQRPPSSDAVLDTKRILPSGTKLLVAGPDIQADGISWKSVRDPSGNQGWILADKLVPIAAETLATTSGPASPALLEPNPIEFTGQFDQSALSVGGKLSMTIRVANRGDRAIDGLRIYSQGPWAAFSVAGVVPDGSFNRGLAGSYEIREGDQIRPGEVASITIVAIPNEPGNHTFSFVPFDLDGTALRTQEGRIPSLGEMVSVSR